MQLLLKITAVYVVALIADILLRRGRASVRHLPPAAAFMAVPVIVTAALVGPRVPIELPVAAVAFTVRSIAGASNLSFWFAIVWIAGTIITLLPAAVGLLESRRLRRTSMEWPEAQVLGRLLAAENGITRPVDVVCVHVVRGPMTCGVRRPLVVFPLEARAWPSDDLRRALLHEIAHVRRGDWALQTFAHVIAATLWFHPLVWIVRRRLQLAAECACDDAVVVRDDATRYAEQLLTLAERYSYPSTALSPAMAARGDLVQRVGAILNQRQARGRAGRADVLLTTTMAVMLVAVVAPLNAMGPIAWELPAAPSQVAFDTPAGLQVPVAELRSPLQHRIPQPGRRPAGGRAEVRVITPRGVNGLPLHMRLLIAWRQRGIDRPFHVPTPPGDAQRWAAGL